MSRQYGLIVVEGHHDQAFVSKVLTKILHFEEFNGNVSDLEKVWKKFIPSYPDKTGKLYRRLNMPSILLNDSLSVGVYAGEGSNIIENLTIKLSEVDLEELSFFAIVADADKKKPKDVVKDYHNGLKEYFTNFPLEAGEIISDLPKTGIYVLPNNSDDGVLDTLLCDCGKIAYSEYMERAETYINTFSQAERKRLKWKPFAQEKALIATISSVLKPGKTNTVSIKDDKWISKTTQKEVPALAKFVDFLKKFIRFRLGCGESKIPCGAITGDCQ